VVQIENYMRFFKICLVLIVTLGFLLRVYDLSSIPGSLNPDETAIGYTSYSFLMSGADEHGKFLPLSLQSFGDWKLPVYSYIGVIHVALFGLNEFSVRSVSMMSGVIGVLLIYFIGKNLFGKRSIALISALFFAISPWSIYFSRAAYEVNLATTIFLGGFLALLHYFQNKKAKCLILSFILFGITMFTQHNYIIFTPIYVFTVLVIFRKNIIYNSKWYVAISFFVILIAVSYASIAVGGGKKISNLNIFNDKNIIYNRVEKLRGDNSPKNNFIERVFHTRYSGGTYQLVLNYLNSYSPNFLFDKGGEKLVHNIGDVGYFYVFDAFLVMVGLGFLLWNREKRVILLLVPWLIIAPIPSAITRELSGTRLFTIVPVFVLVASYGAYKIITIWKNNKFKYIACGAVALLVTAGFVYFLEYYFVHFNYQRIRFWRYGYREVVKLTDKYPNYNVVMRGPENFPYIYFLFYEKYDPKKFREDVVYYPPTSEGFYFVKSFGKYQFVDRIDYSHLEKNTIYIDDSRLDDKSRSIFLPSGEPILGYYMVDNDK
jgi:4-amino-4-deoxy-L-arabinose transferase-like glycosyltransferase